MPVFSNPSNVGVKKTYQRSKISTLHSLKMKPARMLSTSHICGGAVKGGKICLCLKSDEDPACKGHEPGSVQVADGIMYVREAKEPMSTLVYDSHSMPATKLSQDLLEFFVDATVEDLARVGPMETFVFVQ